MKRLLFVVVILLTSLIVVQPALAQGTYGYGTRDWGKFGFSVGPDFVLPVTSGFKDVYSIGYGGTVRGEYAFTPDISGMLTAGYIVLKAKDVMGITPDNGSMIPVTAGLKYYFFPGNLRWYAAIDLGITSFKSSGVSVTVPILGTVSTGSATSTEFTWQPQLGMAAKFSDNAAFDVAVRWIGIKDANSVGIRFAVLFLF